MRKASLAAAMLLTGFSCQRGMLGGDHLFDALVYFNVEYCFRNQLDDGETRFAASYLNHLALTQAGTLSLSSSTFGATGGAGARYHGAILAANGKIYAIPRDHTLVQEIDPDARTITTLGSAVGGGTAYLGGAAASNGKIYAVPYNAANVLEIDPVNRTTSVFSGTLSGAARYDSAARAPNGNIYAIPTNTGIPFLEIDPVARTAVTFGGSPVAVGSAYSSAAVGPNGLIYALPYAAAQILELDPVQRTYTLYGAFTAGPAKWQGIVVGANGNLYGIPVGGNPVLEFNPYTKSYTSFGAGSFNGGGVLLPGGSIYAFPNGLIDPVNRTVTILGGLPTTGYNGGRLALNGKIYLVPDTAATIAEVSTGSGSRFCTSALLSPYMNKSM